MLVIYLYFFSGENLFPGILGSTNLVMIMKIEKGENSLWQKKG